VPRPGASPAALRRARPPRRRARLHGGRRAARARAQRRGAHARGHGAGPRVRRVAQLRGAAHDHGPRGVPRGGAHRVPDVRAARRRRDPPGARARGRARGRGGPMTATTTVPVATAGFAVRVRLGAGHADLSLEPVDPVRDAALVQGWLAHPRSAFWQLGHLDVDGVRAYLAGVGADPHQDAWLGRVDGVPAFLVETYDPARVTLADVPAAVALLEPGDVGMHLLVAPPDGPARRGFTSAVMGAVVRFCLDPAGCGARRVVVEPDVRNTAVAAKNAAAGFRVLREVAL